MIQSPDSLSYLAAFLGGVLASFTPCIYPLIPIIIGIIGSSAAGSKTKGFILSFTYVTGIAVTYSILGLFASLTGKFFGSISTHFLTQIIVGAFIIFCGFSLAGSYSFMSRLSLRLNLPSALRPMPVFFIGLISGLLISPCLTPILGSILAFIATRKNIIFGSTLLFTFAYGMGLVLILAGTSSALLAGLPKSGRWLEAVKKICDLIFVI